MADMVVPLADGSQGGQVLGFGGGGRLGAVTHDVRPCLRRPPREAKLQSDTSLAEAFIPACQEVD